MSNVAAWKELVSCRSTWKGVVTRHANTIRRGLDTLSFQSEDDYDEVYGKLLDAKTNFDNAQQEVLRACGPLDIDTREQEDIGHAVTDSIRDIIDGYHQGKRLLFPRNSIVPEQSDPHPLSVSHSSLIETSVEGDMGSAPLVDEQSPRTVLRLENESLRQKLARQEERSDLLLRSVQELTEQVKALATNPGGTSRHASSPMDRERRITFERQDISKVPVRGAFVGAGGHEFSDDRYHSGPPDVNAGWRMPGESSGSGIMAGHFQDDRRRDSSAYEYGTTRGPTPYDRPDSSHSAPRRSPYRDGYGPVKRGDNVHGEWRDYDPGHVRDRSSTYRCDFGVAENTLSLHQYLLEQSQLQHRSMMSMLHAPQTKLPMFNGDPLEYSSFMNAFDDLVDSVLDNPRSKLTSLLAHCEKRARDVIASCVHKRADVGYRSARDLLRKKFGDPTMIAQAWIQKLMEYPQLKTADQLESFAADLVSARDSLDSLGHLNELNCTNSIRMIVVKLPFHLRNRWRKAYRLSRVPGESTMIAQAWIQKLMEYPQLKTADQLESFAADLVSARDSLDSLGHLNELNCTNSIRMIVVKLPFHLRNRWRKAYRLSRVPGESSPLEQLISLVTEAAEDASDPVYNEEALSRVRNTYEVNRNKEVRREFPTARRGQVHFSEQPPPDEPYDGEPSSDFAEEYAFHVGQRRPPCAACGASHHFMSRCRVFKDMGPASRLEFAKTKNLCILCLSSEHVIKDCKLPWKCQERGCGGRHHTALHASLASHRGNTLVTSTFSPAKTADHDDSSLSAADALTLATMMDSSCCDPEDTGDVRGSVNIINHSAFFTNNSPTLPLTPVILRNGELEIQTYALLDNASTLTLCHSSLMQKLGLKEEGRGTISVNTLHSRKSIEGSLVSFDAKAVGCTGFHRDCGEFQPVVEAITIDTLPISMEHILAGDRIRKWPHLKQINVPLDKAASVELLVGQDNSHLLEPLEKRVGRLFEPYGVLTRLGWTIYGSAKGAQKKHGSTHFAVAFPDKSQGIRMDEPLLPLLGKDTLPADINATERVTCYEASSGLSSAPASVISPDVESSLSHFWQGEEVPDVVSRSHENDPAIKRWERDMKVINGKIHLPIPYKEEPPRCPNNYNAARKALIAQGRQLVKKGPKAVAQYVTSMNKNFTGGYAEVVDEDTETDPLYEFYTLHHGVDHIKKPDTTRIVNNGSGKFHGVSLSTLTHHGPDLMNSLVAVLTAFRRYFVGSLADVESMFNQVMVYPLKHRDSLRFVWWENGVIGGKIIVCRYTTHIFGMSWSPSAAMFALRKTVELYAQNITPRITRSVLDDFYVDDWLNSEQRAEIAAAVLEGVRATLGHSGMNLTKVASTSREVIQSVPERARAKELVSMDLVNDALPRGSTLGVGIDLEEDCFIFAVTLKPQPPTRRGLTASVASLYDPVGFLAPFILPAKLLLRETCKAGKRWDEVLDESVSLQWRRWLTDVALLSDLKIPRWLGCADGLLMVLHTFGDASELSYGAVSYVCSEREDGGIDSACLALAKSKLAPTKTLPIPKLEMNAAVVSTRITRAVDTYLSGEIKKWYLWTDSSLVLLFVSGNPADYKPFYANRSSYIQQNTPSGSWHHVPGVWNPADCLSRGMKAEDLVASRLWRSGPEFLRSPQEQWPKLNNTAKIPEDELKKHKPVYAVSQVFLPDEGGYTFMTTKGGDQVSVRVSGLKELVSRSSNLQVTIRAVAWLRRYLLYVPHGMLKKGELDVEELAEAKRYVVRVNQRFYMSEEQRKSKTLRKLFPRDEMGVLVVGGRLSNCAALSVRARRPYVLPKDSPMARQVVQFEHDKIGHPGVDRTLYETRQEYWILGGRKFISAFLKKCLKCRRAKAAPLQQLMGDLPQSRVQPFMPPFTNTGVDLFGPFTIIVKRSHDKRYGVLFTCMTSRAIHIEVAVDLSTSAFINTLERFVARRGRPAVLSSDNGKNFIGAKSHVQAAGEVLSDPVILRKTTDAGIKWLLNTPAASHQGGVWERMIRSVRQVLFFLLEKHPVTEDKLRTVFCMAENLVNSRPITRVSDDPDALDALSPNHLLTVREPRLVFRKEFSGDQYRRDWREVQHLSTTYWNLWMRDYLPSLQLRTKWCLETEDIEVGELVLLVQDQYHRSQWPLGVIRETYPGQDGRVRNVLVKTCDGLYRRPISKIVRLEGD